MAQHQHMGAAYKSSSRMVPAITQSQIVDFHWNPSGRLDILVVIDSAAEWMLRSKGPIF
jgi:hypothetical protein